MILFNNFLEKTDKSSKKLDEIAELLKISPETLEIFEEKYKNAALSSDKSSDNLFDKSIIEAKQEKHIDSCSADVDLEDICHRIVNELLEESTVYRYNGVSGNVINHKIPSNKIVTKEELNSIPKELRPNLTGRFMQVDIAEKSYITVLEQYKHYIESKDDKQKELFYKYFRQGLDILDLDYVLYEMLSLNKNRMGNWFPQLVYAIGKQDFFKVPKTTILKVPIALLQLSRIDYFALTPTTIRILDEYCQRVFFLEEDKEYFVKTGTYSSKFDFRNAHVKGEKEVRELGEYLLFIHFLANQMASPLAQPCIYGVSTTNEWVVREYIQDKENNPCIYKGMPLHTEFRFFVDFDTDEILGVNPYWDSKVMKDRFLNHNDADSPHQKHDYVIYTMHEEELNRRYEEALPELKKQVSSIIKDIDLEGQWSLDIMKNGDDYYIIDMALARNSALIECVPKDKLKELKEDWIPKLTTAGTI